jgi:hypothetical protein
MTAFDDAPRVRHPKNRTGTLVFIVLRTDHGICRSSEPMSHNYRMQLGRNI